MKQFHSQIVAIAIIILFIILIKMLAYKNEHMQKNKNVKRARINTTNTINSYLDNVYSNSLTLIYEISKANTLLQQLEIILENIKQSEIELNTYITKNIQTIKNAIDFTLKSIDGFSSILTKRQSEDNKININKINKKQVIRGTPENTLTNAQKYANLLLQKIKQMHMQMAQISNILSKATTKARISPTYKNKLYALTDVHTSAYKSTKILIDAHNSINEIVSILKTMDMNVDTNT